MRVPERYFVIFTVILCIVAPLSALGAVHGRLGVGYGGELRENRDISQFEIFWRQPLHFTKSLSSGWLIRTAVEGGGAFIRESGADKSAGRVSLMPQLILDGGYQCNFVIGFGAGVMVGDTEFTAQNLGGPFFLASKLGFLYQFTERWGVEYTFYHQSNGGIYDHNASINMVQLALSYHF